MIGTTAPVGAADPQQIRKHMGVISSDGRHLGTIDTLEGDQIRLAGPDPPGGGRRPSIPVRMVAVVDDVNVYLDASAELVRHSLAD